MHNMLENFPYKTVIEYSHNSSAQKIKTKHQIEKDPSLRIREGSWLVEVVFVVAPV